MRRQGQIVTQFDFFDCGAESNGVLFGAFAAVTADRHSHPRQLTERRKHRETRESKPLGDTASG